MRSQSRSLGRTLLSKESRRNHGDTVPSAICIRTGIHHHSIQQLFADLLP